MGHHLPGMIRAYGDRALFERFKWRFIFAPLFLLVTCVAFFWWDLKGILLVVFFWGVWHGLMQTYGFCRSTTRKRGLRYAHAPARFRGVPDLVCHCGGTFPISAERHAGHVTTCVAGRSSRPAVVQLGQNMILGAAIFVSVLFAAHFVRTWIAGTGRIR